jgi:ParB family transcriptional regulator, chromosome partitioning protein
MTQEPAKKRGLGMGLSALLGHEAPGPAVRPPSQNVPIEFLTASPLQPRRRFPEAELLALADSLRTYGVLQPLLVRPRAGTAQGYAAPGFEIIAGERRWRAAQLAGLDQLPVVVRELDDREVLEIALVENLQREDLSPIEEAEGYQRLIDEFGRTQEELAREIGKSRPHIANTLRLLKLPETVRRFLEEGRLTAGHARTLLGADDPEGMARSIIERGMSVRDTEAMVQTGKLVQKSAKGRLERDPDLVAFEDRLRSAMGLACQIKPKAKGGTLTIRYTTLDQLERIARQLSDE